MPSRNNYLDKEGLRYYNTKLQEIINSKADAATVNSQITALDSKIDTTKIALEGSISTTNSNLSTLRTNTESSISSLNTKDTQHDTAITNLQTKDTQHDTAIASLVAKDDEFDTDISSLQTKDTQQDTAISTLQAKDTQHDTAIASLNNTKADKTSVTQEITSAISGVTQFDYQVVEELPLEGTKGVIYLVLYSQEQSGDIYKEYIWVDDGEDARFECLGYTNEIDLDNYVTFDDTITNADIDAMFS